MCFYVEGRAEEIRPKPQDIFDLGGRKRRRLGEGREKCVYVCVGAAVGKQLDSLQHLPLLTRHEIPAAACKETVCVYVSVCLHRCALCMYVIVQLSVTVCVCVWDSSRSSRHSYNGGHISPKWPRAREQENKNDATHGMSKEDRIERAERRGRGETAGTS